MSIGNASLQVLQHELDSTLELAETSLQTYLENPSDAKSIESFREAVGQIKGVGRLIEMRGAEQLANEMLEAAGLLTNAGSNTQRILLALGQSVFLLRRYLEYQLDNPVQMPELLVPTINDVRIARGTAALAEGAFYPSPKALPAAKAAPALTERQAAASKRLRHMYQLGLLGLLRDRDPVPSSKLMIRSLDRLGKLHANFPSQPSWLMAAATLEAISARRLVLTRDRKLLFSQIDQTIKQLAAKTAGSGSAAAPAPLTRSLAYLLALSGAQTSRVEQTMRLFKLAPLPYTEADVQNARSQMLGPDSGAFMSVAAAVKEEVAAIKDTLDLADRGAAGTTLDFDRLTTGLHNLAKTLRVVGMDSAVQLLEQQQPTVASWREQGQIPKGPELAQLAETLLYVEGNVASLTHSPPAASQGEASPAESIAKNQFQEARGIVIEECRARLAQARGSISACLESGWARAHLESVPEHLDAVRGGLSFVDERRAAGLLSACLRYVKDKMLPADAPPDHESLETFADALSSVEYHLDTIGHDSRGESAVLDLAEESIKALGYAP